MWIQRYSLLTKSIQLRYFCQKTTFPFTETPIIHSYSYLEGFPKPDPEHDETIIAIPRANSGRILAAQERKVGRVPSLLFEQEKGEEGGNKRLISVKTNQIKKFVKKMGRSYFLSRLFDLEVRPTFTSDEIIEKVRVFPRLLQLHVATDEVLNVTFLRAPSNALLKVDVPLLFIGEDVSPGLRKGAFLNTIKRSIKFLCPADIIPPYIEVDLSKLDVGQSILRQDLKVHPALKLIGIPDEPICNIKGSRVSEGGKKK